MSVVVPSCISARTYFSAIRERGRDQETPKGCAASAEQHDAVCAAGSGHRMA